MSQTPNIGGADTIDPRDQYLWDRSGPVDAAVALLERAAAPLRFRPVGSLQAARARVQTRAVWRRGPAIAALLALGAVVVFFAMPGRSPTPGPAATWTIAKSTGATIGAALPLKSPTTTTQPVATGAAGGLVLKAAGGTSVEIGPDAAANILETGADWPGIELQQGAATIAVGESARPVTVGVMGESLTFAPRARATVTIGGKGGASVAVTGGTAEAKVGDVVTRFAPGTASEVQADGSLPVPVRETADAAFKGTVRKVEALVYEGDAKSARFVADQLMRLAKPADAPTVWNMLVRAKPEHRRVLRDVLAKLVKAPGQPAFDGVLKLEPAAMDAWWKAALDAK